MGRLQGELGQRPFLVRRKRHLKTRNPMNRPLPTNRLSLRIDVRNPDHHLWNNNGTWWCHFTVHTPCHTKHRIRRSLHTNDRNVARARRDELLGQIQPQQEVAA